MSSPTSGADKITNVNHPSLVADNHEMIDTSLVISDEDECILIHNNGCNKNSYNINGVQDDNGVDNVTSVLVDLELPVISTNGTASGPDDKEQLLAPYNILKELCNSNIEFYQNDETSKGQRLHGAFIGLIDHIDIAKPLILQINEFAHEYDFDANTPGNGYRSFVYVTECCINHGIKICRYITDNRNSLLFRKGIYMKQVKMCDASKDVNDLAIQKEIEACHHLLASLCTCLQQLLTIRSWSEPGDLFASDLHTPEELFSSCHPINQYPFYGRCLGFQFCESMRPVLKFIQICMAGFSEAYYSNGGKIAKATSSMWTGGKYFMDPELRSRRIVNISWNAKIEFCKSFWDLAESEMMQKLPKFGAQAKINKLITLNPDPMRIPKVTTNEYIDVPIPMSYRGACQLNVRLISSTRRDGMYGGQANCRRKTAHSVTNGLIFHCHGGGFVAQSSKSHENYLIEWTTKLNIPIISVDYSLAPESPFPRALEEVFFAYCWANNNCDLLGTTAERIILVGDSAGANLCFSLALKTIEMGVRKPDGIFAAYCPVLLSRNPSPGRLLCMMDPLLPYGFMMRCMKAYGGIPNDPEDKGNSSKLNSPISKSSLATVLETKEEEVDGEFIKVSQQQVNKVDSGSEKSDSFEENSVWEHIQASDSDLQHLQAHKSPVSDATSDTLAGASFRSQTGVTNDILTPDEANGIILDDGDLDLDPPPNTTNLTKDESGFDNKNMDQSGSSKAAENFDLESYLEEKEQTSSEYVSDFIGRYVLDTKVESDGTTHPILRSVSRTQSEENIVFDIGREAITSQNIQEKITKVATNLATAVTTTINTMSSANSVEENAQSSSSMVSSIDKPVEMNLTSEFDFEMPKNCFISPYLADDEMLSQLPSVKIFTVYSDPCLDDCVMFAKKLKKLGVPVGLDILKGLPHGFLNFSTLSKEANNASHLCVQRLAELLNLKLIQKSK